MFRGQTVFDRDDRQIQLSSDLGRQAGLLPAPGPDEPPPAATAVLLTAGDLRLDWLRAGQALHRVLAHAATAWVFASLSTEPLEYPVIRDLIRTRLAAPGPMAPPAWSMC